MPVGYEELRASGPPIPLPKAVSPLEPALFPDVARSRSQPARKRCPARSARAKSWSQAGSARPPSKDCPTQFGLETASDRAQAEPPEHTDGGNPPIEVAPRKNLTRSVPGNLRARSKAKAPRVPDGYPSYDLGFYTDPSHIEDEFKYTGVLQEKTKRLARWHRINAEVPGLQLLRKWAPFVFLVPGVLSKKECEAIVRVATPLQQPSKRSKDNPARRTSTDCRLHWDDCPRLLQRLGRILNMDVANLEPPKVIKYQRGQYFQQHTDAHPTVSDEPTQRYTEAYGNRSVAMIVYLNDVAEGGSTTFNHLGLKIRPKQGLAVIHFPSDVQGNSDHWTQHAGEKARSEKWILSLWGSECALKRDCYERCLAMTRLDAEVF